MSEAWTWTASRADGVGELSLSRPPVNALDWTAKRALVTHLEAMQRDSSMRALVISSGHPTVFCAGSDLRELALDHGEPGSATARTAFEFDMWELLSGAPLVSIAAIEGHALGSGCEMAIACDFRVAGRDARFGLPEVKIGGAPGTQTLARLPSLIGAAAARRMLLLGESVTAADAQALGLVDLLVEPGGAREAASELARRLAQQPTSSILFLKQVLAAGGQAALQSVRSTVMGSVETLFTAPEMREGIAAFLQKRSPRFHSGDGGPSE